MKEIRKHVVVDSPDLFAPNKRKPMASSEDHFYNESVRLQTPFVRVSLMQNLSKKDRAQIRIATRKFNKNRLTQSQRK